MWKRVERETLPRHSSGVDWGTECDVVLRCGEVRVSKTRGHTAWTSCGQTGYYSPSWYIGTGDTLWDCEALTGPLGCPRVSTNIWRSWLGRIAEALGLTVGQMPDKPPRGCTLVWVEQTKRERSQ